MKPMKLFCTILLNAFLIMPAAAAGFPAGQSDQINNQDDETQFEEVSVVNTQVPVRVFKDNLPVGDLKKEDFELFVNNKPKPIHVFYEVRKRLGDSPETQPTQNEAATDTTNTTTPNTSNPNLPPDLPPRQRLFVLIFNVSDYHMNLEKDVNTVFNEILRVNDRYMVITNSYFLPERRLKNREMEKTHVLDTLQKEINKLKIHFIQTEVDLRTLSTNFLSQLAEVERKQQMAAAGGGRENTEDPLIFFREFFRDYLVIFEQARQGYFGMSQKQYVRIAEYLKSQDDEKWVLSFYQVGIFPKFKSMGAIQKRIAQYSENENQLPMKKLLMNFLPRLDDVDQWSVRNIGKLFINSGATVHTLLIKPVLKTAMTDYDYQPIPTDSESILREIARKTGGSLMHATDTEDFINAIKKKEDILYMLTYIPDPNEDKNAYIKIDLKLNKKGAYRLSYDNQRKPKLFRQILNKMNQDNPQVRIETVVHQNGVLSVVVSNIKTIKQMGSDPNGRIGKIQAKITLMDSQAKVIWETTKGYQCKQNKSMFRTQLPQLEKGNYDVLVEVKDILSWKSDASGEHIKI